MPNTPSTRFDVSDHNDNEQNQCGKRLENEVDLMIVIKLID